MVFKKGYKQTKENKRKIHLALKGKPRLKESKIKQSETMKRLYKEGNSKIGFQKGHKDFVSKKARKQSRKKISKKLKGNPMIRKFGKFNSNWQGGISKEPYGQNWTNKLRETIRKRDNQECQECGKLQEELKRLLGVHHIDYNKQNNSPLNLISLCLRCHSKTNSNRKHWEQYFKMKMFINELFDPKNILIFGENKQLIGVNRI